MNKPIKNLKAKPQERAFLQEGFHLKWSVEKLNQESALAIRKTLIEEFNAASAMELMVIDLLVNAYFRSLNASAVYSVYSFNEGGNLDYADQQRINTLKEIGKQIDSANHQFMNALTLLKELKQPGVQVKIEAKEAYFGNNQQINK